jgi:ribosome-associated protein
MDSIDPLQPDAPSIRLDQFLKHCGITSTGGQAKYRIQSGEVRVNGAVETRRGHNLHPGDVVEVDGKSWTVGDLRL